MPEICFMAQSWHAIRVRSNQEKIAATHLAARMVEVFSPSYDSKRTWSDRIITTARPLFPGYIFARYTKDMTLAVVSCPGISSVVSFGAGPAEIADSELESVRSLIGRGRNVKPCPYVAPGAAVDMVNGPFAGLRGVISQVKSGYRVVVSIHLLQRSVQAELDLDTVLVLPGASRNPAQSVVAR